jgi:hypothetical protein
MKLESNLENAYLEAYRIACASLQEKQPYELSLNTNAVFIKAENKLKLKYLNVDFIIDCSSGDVRVLNSEVKVTTTVKVLMLHYLLNAKIRPLSGKLISFKEIAGGGAIYYQTFYKRAIAPFIKAFLKNTENYKVLNIGDFFEAAKRLSGIKESYGDASITINVFPLVPITYVLWQGDDEIAPSGTILFDETITSFLPSEDIVLAASFGTYELMKLAGEGKDN